ERAQKEFPGVLYEYELEEYKDTFVHEVELLDPEQNKKHEIKIDISSGEVVQAFTERGNPWFEKDEAMDAAKTIKKRGFSMLNAMAQLPRDGSTLLTDAKFKQTQGISFFELEFFGQNGEEEILVNAATQSIIPRFKKN
ncbi:MAG TPA: PepSY domain-containing protein, partial [Gammaproteobacteria bacterium]